MKKLVAATIVSCILFGSGVVFAEEPRLSASQSHVVTVTIPELLMIRFVNDSNAAVTPNAVAFALEADTFEPEGVNRHTNAPNWSDIRVFSNAADWVVSVHTANGVGDFDWRKIEVRPSEYAAFNLPQPGESVDIAENAFRTDGWLSLGISPSSYILTLAGDEEPETYTTTVIYTIASF